MVSGEWATSKATPATIINWKPHQRLSGAEHLVSLAEPSEPSAGGTQWPGGPHPPGNEGFMQSPPLHYLFLEYLPHGDLLDLCIKLNQNDEHNHYHNTRYTTMIPRRLLWRIFLCRRFAGANHRVFRRAQAY